MDPCLGSLGLGPGPEEAEGWPSEPRGTLTTFPSVGFQAGALAPPGGSCSSDGLYLRFPSGRHMFIALYVHYLATGYNAGAESGFELWAF